MDLYADETAAAPPPRFFVFAGYAYYPEGGVKDFRSVHPDLDSAEESARSHTEEAGRDWAHVAELTDEGLVIVTRFGRG